MSDRTLAYLVLGSLASLIWLSAIWLHAAVSGGVL